MWFVVLDLTGVHSNLRMRRLRMVTGTLQWIVIHDIRYRSSKDGEHCNLVIFATQDDLMEKDGSPVTSKRAPNPEPWIRLLDENVLCECKGEPS